jgi:hypothetical protein
MAIANVVKDNFGHVRVEAKGDADEASAGNDT